MKVPIARMKDIKAAKTVFFFKGADVSKHFTQTPPRDGAINAVVVWRDPSLCWERIFAPRPKPQPLGL